MDIVEHHAFLQHSCAVCVNCPMLNFELVQQYAFDEQETLMKHQFKSR